MLEQHRNNGANVSKRYTATPSQGQGRSGWSVIFRHPALIDPATEKPGRRVRRGLGTNDREQADQLVAELNRLLEDERYWTATARAEASARFSPLAVAIFFDRLAPEEGDPGALRESLLPVATEGVGEPKRVLLIGTTGAGKTTVLRQLIGTSPRERFPSTSKAKTTIHDAEFLVRPGPYCAVVTFASYDEIEEYVKENLVQALVEARGGCDDQLLLKRVLRHVNERMRFNYVLGNGPLAASDDEDEDETVGDGDNAGEDALIDTVWSVAEDLARTNGVLVDVLATLRALAPELDARARVAVEEAGVSDAHVVQQLFDEHFEGFAREDGRFHGAVDHLMDELRHRYSYLTLGSLQRSTTGWPTAWTFVSSDRAVFLRAIRRFASNDSRVYGQLLTPLVNGIRVAGEFAPAWGDGDLHPLVLMDGEGLGHTPRSAAAISSSLMRRIEAADYVLLADNGEQAMQAAPGVAIRELVASGNVGKLVIAFTHMDRLRADNLRSDSERRDHVMAASLNVAASVGEAFGSLAERALRRRLDEACFYLGFVDCAIRADAGARQARALDELHRLYAALVADLPAFQLGASRPRYSTLVLAMAAQQAVAKYIEPWSWKLGIASGPERKEPWQRIKALARRLAAPQMGDEYDGLRPVADFRRSLSEALYKWIQAPVSWSGPEPSADEKQALFDAFAESVSVRMGALADRRVRNERLLIWREAYGLRGRFSTFSRSRRIHDDILSQAAPNPDVALSPEASRFLDELVSAVREAAANLDIELQSA